MRLYTRDELQDAVNTAAESVGKDMPEGKNKELVKAGVRSFVRSLNSILFPSLEIPDVN